MCTVHNEYAALAIDDHIPCDVCVLLKIKFKIV